MPRKKSNEAKVSETKAVEVKLPETKVVEDREPEAETIKARKPAVKVVEEKKTEVKTIKNKKPEVKAAVKKKAEKVDAKAEVKADAEGTKITKAPARKAATKKATGKTTEKKTTVKKATVKKNAAPKTDKKSEEAETAAVLNNAITEAAPVPARKKILFAGSEVLPFAATGGLGEVLGSLPKALAATGDFDVRVIMPYYSDISEEYRSAAKYLCNYNVGLAWRNLYCGLFELKKDNVIYYFIDNEYYFRRDGLYGFYDDGERYAFFCKAVMDSFQFTGFMPDIIHANDWQTALIPIYNTCKYHYDLKTIFTIHNIEYQGMYDLSILNDVFDLPPQAGAFVEYKGSINLLKGAIETSDLVTTVSESYANELHDPTYAHGLESIINKNSFKMRGILNGIDAEGYDPANDKNISSQYTVADLSGKAADKKELQELANLYQDPNVPIVAIISRLVQHKGMDLVIQAIENVVRGNVQLVVLGKGDRGFENYFLWLQSQYRGKVSAMITYNKGLSRKIYAGADMFLMPSRSEPCGLSQMIACRYGTVPIVRKTGGLRDSIKDCGGGEGNGFTFSNYTASDMQGAIYRALGLYDDRDNWDKLRRYIMTIDFSWAKSAGDYKKMYNELLDR